MKKLHVKIEGKWIPVFAHNGGRIITCENHPNKALPPSALWAEDDLLYFRSKFANHEFALIKIQSTTTGE